MRAKARQSQPEVYATLGTTRNACTMKSSLAQQKLAEAADCSSPVLADDPHTDEPANAT
jgi:hypothetical protein